MVIIGKSFLYVLKRARKGLRNEKARTFIMRTNGRTNGSLIKYSLVEEKCHKINMPTSKVFSAAYLLFFVRL